MQVPFLDLQHCLLGGFFFFLHIKKKCINMKAFIVLSQIYEDPPASPAALTPSLHRDVHGSADMGLPCAQTPPLGPLNHPPTAHGFSISVLSVWS